MKRIRNILLVAGADSNRKLFIDEVAAVAIDAGARVTVLGVIEAAPDDQDEDSKSADLQGWMIEDKAQEMEDVSSELKNREIQVATRQTTGKLYLEVIREVLRGNYDLVMKPAESQSGVKKFLFGGTDMQLFRLCPVPVWAFKPTLNTELGKVMVAVDLHAFDPEINALADTVLQWGKHVASLTGSVLHVVHIWDLYGEATLRRRLDLEYTINTLVQAEEAKHRQWLNQALARNGLNEAEIQVHFHKGETTELIPAIAHAMEADLLVMGTVGRTGIAGLFIGNTAESVLRQVDCSVLAIKPEGFLTPVSV